MKMPTLNCLSNIKLIMVIIAVLLSACSKQDQPQPSTENDILIVSTIRPLHLITQALLDGVGQSQYIIQGTDVHGYQLSPSQIKLMNKADFVVGIGESFEGNVSELFGENDFVFDNYQSELNLLSVRDTLMWHKHEAQEEHEEHEAQEEHEEHDAHMENIDMHFWLSSENAKLFSRLLSHKLSATFPEHQSAIDANLQALIGDITSQEIEFKAQLQKNTQPAFMVFHDGFHYLTDQYQLNEVAAIVSDPSQSTGIKTMLELKALIIENSVACIFVEPGFNQGLVDTLTESVFDETKTQMRVLTWDVLGNDAENFPELLNSIYKEYLMCHPNMSR